MNEKSKTTFDIIQSIRSKYVGTADEHALLAKLTVDAGYVNDEIKRERKEFQKEVDDINSKQYKIQEWVQSSARIDCAFYRWFQHDGNLEWLFDDLIGAFKGRGVTLDVLKKVVEEWESKSQTTETKEQ
jgi:hypothetical protein